MPAKPKGEEKINVTFEIDQQNLLKVKATSSSSAQELEIKRS
ncbi:MAG: Hsp70 family protein [Xenococcus sp. (in: cyanobacteria)]